MEKRIKFNGEIFRNGNELADYLKDIMFTSNCDDHLTNLAKTIAVKFKYTKNPALVCVGSRKVNFDIFGPIIYDEFLKEGITEKHLYWFNGINAEDVINEIKRNNHDLIIAFDAALAFDNNIEMLKLKFRTGGVKPGAGVNKHITEVGDFSIILPVGYKFDIKTITNIERSNEWYRVEDIRHVAAKFTKTFMNEVKNFYNFLEDSNKNLIVPN